MKRNGYLNFILTVNAVLLSALVWVQVVETPLADSANAQVRTKPSAKSETNGVPNAGQQRMMLVQEMRETRRSIESVKALLTSGNIKVQVTNLDQVKVTMEQ